jgi:hypothetical protein
MECITCAQDEVMPLSHNGCGSKIFRRQRQGVKLVVNHRSPDDKYFVAFLKREDASSDFDREGAGNLGQNPLTDKECPGSLLVKPAAHLLCGLLFCESSYDSRCVEIIVQYPESRISRTMSAAL